MANLAFHLEVLDQVINKLVAGHDPRGTLMKKHPEFAALGALGPDLLRYQPISQQLSDALHGLVTSNPPGQLSAWLPPAPTATATTLANLSELLMNPTGAIYSMLFRELVVPAWPTLNSLNALISKLDAIAQAQDTIAAVEAATELNGLQGQISTLTNLQSGLTNVTAVVIQILALPPWMEQTSVIPTPPADIHANRLSEFLRWHKSGDFAANLLKNATTDEEKAFALGWMCHAASSVTGEPFINNITGGPYRTHWWRNRLVSNFVDSWVFGFFQTHATMNDDQPTPTYDQWQPLCTVNLQNIFNVGNLANGVGNDVPDAVKAMASGVLGTLPAQFPADLARLLQKTVVTTYPAASLPTFATFSEEVFKEAYVGAFAVYWFMTSGSGAMGINDVGTPACTTEPSWISSNSTPSPQQGGLNPTGVGCAIALAILALLALLFGDLPAAAAAIAALLNAPIINWPTVRCNLFWMRKTLFDAESALRDLLVKNGLAYPPPGKLGTINLNGQTQPAVDQTPGQGVPLTRTNGFGGGPADRARYPREFDATNQAPDLNFISFPQTVEEQPATINWIPANLYPNFVVNGAGLQNGGILSAPVYPTANKFFGDAVSNALQVIAHNGVGLHNYNLDADRGYGWLGWHPAAGSTPATPPVQDQAD
jgi:hypothetical protein